ncbi:hypothetical protein B296_00021962, partial [Ensete ventricosum]
PAMGVALLSDLLTEVLIPVAAVVGIVFAMVQWLVVSKVKLSPEVESSGTGNSKNGYSDYLIEEEEGLNDHNVVVKCAEIQSAISEEYQYVGIFMAVFAILIFVFLGSVEGFSMKNQPCTYNKDKTCKPALANAFFSTLSFLLGAFTSVVSGFLGMKIATYANARTTLEARKGVGKAFITAFRSGAVMGFLLAANGLLVLYISINLFKLYYGEDWEGLFEAITGYGLGGSSMALFGRVGGGIYTKAADVGADLVGKVERNIPEDDPRNPAVIADNVGDNVGDIAGMGSDLFGSYAESSCAALVVASISSFGINHELTSMLYPLLISSMGIIVCLVTTLFATDFFEIKTVKEIEPALKKQLIISTALMTVGIAIVIAALGMLSTIATGLAIDAYGPISDNAGGIAEMAGMSHRIRERTDALDAAGNTTAAIGKSSCNLDRRRSHTQALKMVEEVRRQFNNIPGLMEGSAKPDYATCVKISTDASIKEMIPPGALVMLTPLVVGTLFGVETLSGVLAGSLVSGVQVASEHARSLGPKGSDAHKAAVIGDTIGDPLKDTSGPSLNILIKLMAVESLVFAPFFATHGGILFKYL